MCQQRPFKISLEKLSERSKNDSSLNVKEILEILAGKNRLLVLIFLSLPFCQPLPIPGLSTLFGMIVAIVGLQYSFSKKIWLPQKILEKKIASINIQKMCLRSLKLMKKIGSLVHPRWGFLFNRGMEIFNGLLLSLLGLLLALPLPIPLTNLAVGWAILLISLGLLENDGVVVSLGYFIAFLTILFFISLPFSVKLFLNEKSTISTSSSLVDASFGCKALHPL